MGVRLHWFLPTDGDSRTDPGDIAYISQVARAAEAMGFEGALTQAGSGSDDALIVTAALTQLTRDLKFLVAFRPGLQSPTLAAQAAATYQRLSGGRLLLNVVVGDDAAEQRRHGDTIGKGSRYARADEFLAIVRELWSGEEVDFSGEWFEIAGARLLDPPAWPTVYLGGSSEAAIELAARRADVYLTGGGSPEAVAAQLDAVREAADREGRELGFAIRLDVTTRDTADEVADRIAEYHELGVDEFILSAHPHLEEAYRVGEGLLPVLRDRGLLADRGRPFAAQLVA